MRRYLLYFLLALTLSGCVDNNIVPEDPANGKGGMVIEFGGQSFKDVQITTKGTLPGSVENRVMNLYVMIFATDGSCVYSHFYDRNSRVDNAILPAGERYCWYVDEKDPASGELTRGRLRINSDRKSVV